MAFNLDTIQPDWPGATRWLLSGAELKAGSALCLYGNNGVGKSTFLFCMLGFLPAKCAPVWITHPTGSDDSLSGVLYINSEACYSEGMSISDVLTRYYMMYTGRVLDSVSLHALLDQYQFDPYSSFHLLSTGQKKWCLMLLLTCYEASLWVLDEPFVSLDASRQSDLLEFICRHVHKGGMVVFTAHEKFVCKRFSLLNCLLQRAN
ncbi:MAG: AAA family ATPase [Pseudomonadota bacterium]|nr:AAA family ATPase [Pseudomonadota bacterium]